MGQIIAAWLSIFSVAIISGWLTESIGNFISKIFK
jgi:hypothetical protein